MPQTIRASAATSGSGAREPDGYRSACGRLVRLPSAFVRHQRAHPVEARHLAEAIARIRIPRKGVLVTDVDLGRPVGLSHRVAADPVGPTDEILAARRVGRAFPTRVVTDVDPEQTSFVALVIARDHVREPVLATAYYGRTGRPEPLGGIAGGHPAEREECLEFWSRHALAWVAGHYVEEPFATTWERVMDGRWQLDATDEPLPPVP